MIILAVISGLAIVALSLVTINALNSMQGLRREITVSEASMRTHLQAQVDDLHAKVLAHNWTEYGNTVGQRSAFDRAIAAEAERQPTTFGTERDIDRALEDLGYGEGGEDMMEEGSIVG